MAYWLLKTDPETYSFDDLLSEKTTVWDGIRNFQARNHLAAMKRGDECLIYHSGGERAILGTATVAKSASPEAADKRWSQVGLKAGRRFARPVTLGDIREHPVLSGMAVVRQSRLSVTPVRTEEWEAVLEAARG